MLVSVLRSPILSTPISGFYVIVLKEPLGCIQAVLTMAEMIPILKPGIPQAQQSGLKVDPLRILATQRGTTREEG